MAGPRHPHVLRVAVRSQLYVKEPTFAMATVGRPVSARTSVRQALAHRVRILAEIEKRR